jgi:hypothetical protein
VEAGKYTALTLDFDAQASLTATGAGELVLRPVARLVSGAPTATPPPVEFPEVTVTGLITTVPEYASVDLGDMADLVRSVLPEKVHDVLQALLVLTTDDKAYLVIAALDEKVDRLITAGTVVGRRAPPLKNLPDELDFAGRVVVSDRIVLQEPVMTTPDEVLAAGQRFAFQRVYMHTTYAWTGVRFKKSPPSFEHIGIGQATDRFGSPSEEDYLPVVDPYNTETQIRLAELTGSVLYPTDGLRLILEQVLRFAPEDVEETLTRPVLFYEDLVDDEAQLVNIGDLVPTLQDPTLKLWRFHREVVSVRGFALGTMVRTEDVPIAEKSPVHVTGKVLGVVDLTGAMPVVGLSAEDKSGAVFGYFIFELSVYQIGDGSFAFLLRRTAAPFDVVDDVTRAELGDRVRATLSDYTAVRLQGVEVTNDLTLEEVVLLIPGERQHPMVLTQRRGLADGDTLTKVTVDGFLLDARVLGIPAQFTSLHGNEVIVVEDDAISFERGAAQVAFTPTPLPTPPKLPTPSKPSY